MMENDRYRLLSAYYRKMFGHPVYKLPLDGGFTCPTRDGTKGTGGCIFCSSQGSGESCQSSLLSLSEQIDRMIRQRREALTHSRHSVDGSIPAARRDEVYIGYLQAFSNTYAPASVLREKYLEILSHPDIAGLSAATRPDCFSEDIYQVFASIAASYPVFVELGLQTANDQTADLIGRGYPLAVFDDCVGKLSGIGVHVVVHLILGLPGETEQDWYRTIEHINGLPVEGVKFHLLCLLRGSRLAEPENAGLYQPLSEEDYFHGLAGCLARLRPDLVIHRLTGDAPAELLAAPAWSADKGRVLNAFRHYLKIHEIRQGMLYTETVTNESDRKDDRNGFRSGNTL